jgi:actin-like ATPase involved in cell morphogenesis
MGKQEYIELEKEINSKIYNLRESLKIAKENYIEANKPFEIGDRVMCQSKKTFGYVVSFEINYSNEVKPVCFKEKKDGTQSQIKMYVWNDSDLILAK